MPINDIRWYGGFIAVQQSVTSVWLEILYMQRVSVREMLDIKILILKMTLLTITHITVHLSDIYFYL